MSDKELNLLHYYFECSENLEYDEFISKLESELGLTIPMLVESLDSVDSPEQKKLAKDIYRILGSMKEKKMEQILKKNNF